LGLLKTGTPPRLDGATIDWSAVEMQPGDVRRSRRHDRPHHHTADPVWHHRTTPATHDVIRQCSSLADACPDQGLACVIAIDRG
jgi:tRNA uridine 5-carboxymethylaminomethyl modification enzyme